MQVALTESFGYHICKTTREKSVIAGCKNKEELKKTVISATIKQQFDNVYRQKSTAIRSQDCRENGYKQEESKTEGVDPEGRSHSAKLDI